MRGLPPKWFYGLSTAGPLTAMVYLWWVQKKMVVGAEGSALLSCPVQALSGIPCPSCGTSRTILQILSPETISTSIVNPLAPIVLAVIFILPVWSLSDLLRGKKTLYLAAGNAEKLLLKYRRFTALLLILLAVQWAWVLSQAQIF